MVIACVGDWGSPESDAFDGPRVYLCFPSFEHPMRQVEAAPRSTLANFATIDDVSGRRFELNQRGGEQM